MALRWYTQKMIEERRAKLAIPAAEPLSVPDGFQTKLQQLGTTLSETCLAQLGQFLAKLLAMNQLMNLTSIADPVDAWTRHALDALSLVPELSDVRTGARLLDVGSGGGVPGIPVALARPDLHVTLLDATEKKTAFLQAVAAELGLSNVEVVRGRAESLSASPLGASFDVVTARAVAKISALLPWTAPFAKRGGKLLYIKGEAADSELAAAARQLQRFGCRHVRTVVTTTGRVVVLQVAR